MDILRDFEIPVSGLKLGQHTFQYEVDWRFFEQFEESLVQQGRFSVEIILDKQIDHWFVTFQVSGSMDTECDRCMAPIALPVNGLHHLIVQYHNEEQQRTDDYDSDLVYVPRDIHTWNVAVLIHEFIMLSIPVQRVYACREEASRPCDEVALERLSTKDIQGTNNGLSEMLKQIELKK